MCKGSNTTTTTTAPNAQAGAAYSALLNQAANVASTPYQAYSGELVAPVNAQQQTGIAGINQYANAAQPYYQQAASYANQAAQPISASTIAQYQSPYTQQVVNATEAQFNQQNAIQQSQLTGNAAAQGALGGNRVGVAQGTLAGQQQLAEAPTIAGLYNQGYNTALSTALSEQQNLGNAAYSLGNIGTAVENAGLSGANAQVGAGTLQQQTQQAQDTAAYQQFLNQLAYPYQQTQWLAGIDTGVGSQLGGTSSTTAPAPSILGQLLGAGTTSLGLLGVTGAFGSNGYLTGSNGLFSDKRLKEDIQKIGHTNDGQAIYRFRYKGDDKYQIGFLSQEVEKRHPEAVSKVGGLGLVDYKAATDDAVERDSGGGVGSGQQELDSALYNQYLDNLAFGAPAGSAQGGGIRGLASGGGSWNGAAGFPWANAQGYVPGISITSGRGAPSPPAPYNPQSQQSGNTGIANLSSLKGLFGNNSNSSNTTFGGYNYGDPDLAAAAKAGVESGLQFNPLTGDVYARGGTVRTRRPVVAGFGTGGIVRHLADGGADDDSATQDWFNAYPNSGAPQASHLGSDLGLGDIPSTPSPGIVPGDSGRFPAISEFQSRPAWAATPSADEPLTGGLDTRGIAAQYAPGFQYDFGVGQMGASRTSGADDAYAARTREVQHALNQWGYGGRKGLREDGVMDDSTQLALSDFGKDNGLPAESGSVLSVLNDMRTGNTVRDWHGADGQEQNLTGESIQPGGNGPYPYDEGAPINSIPYGDQPNQAGISAASLPGSGAAGIVPSTTGAAPSSSSGVSPEFWTALTAAGLGMLASKSPFPGVAIGEGGLKGLASYAESQKTRESVEHGRQQLELEAKKAQAQIDMQTKRLQQQQEQMEQGKIPTGYRKTPTGLEAIPGGPSDPEAAKTLAAAKHPQTGEAFSDRTIDMMADAIRKGNTQVLQNLGAGAMKAENVAKVWNRVAEQVAAEGGTGGDLAAARANFTAQMGAAKSQAVREANVAANIAEAQRTFPLAVQASDALPRSSFVPWNRVVQMVQSGTGSPELARFHTAVQGAITAYAQAMARTGVMTVDGRHSAEELLNTAQGPDQFKAVLGQMSKEMEAARAAPEEVRQEILSRISGRPATGAPAAGGAGGDMLSQARDAIARGAPRDAVIQRLRQNGIDPTGL